MKERSKNKNKGPSVQLECSYERKWINIKAFIILLLVWVIFVVFPFSRFFSSSYEFIPLLHTIYAKKIKFLRHRFKLNSAIMAS